MKKILGIVGAFVFALTMLFNTTNFEIKGEQDVALSSLFTLNTANAESWYDYGSCSGGGNITFYTCNGFGRCTYSGSTQGNCN